MEATSLGSSRGGGRVTFSIACFRVAETLSTELSLKVFPPAWPSWKHVVMKWKKDLISVALEKWVLKEQGQLEACAAGTAHLISFHGDFFFLLPPTSTGSVV